MYYFVRNTHLFQLCQTVNVLYFKGYYFIVIVIHNNLNSKNDNKTEKRFSNIFNWISNYTIQGSKLPSNGQVLILYFSTIKEPLILLLGKVRR